jgi:CubicO group peptidase (beta-lactamase class C family)
MIKISGTMMVLTVMINMATGQGLQVLQIDSLLTGLYAEGKINGNFLVADKGKVIYSKSFGFANRSTKELLGSNAVFELASCSKPFTALAIAILAEQQKLDYQDKVTKYFPALENFNSVSVLNLIHHTGGIPDYMSIMDTTWDKAKIAVNKDVIDALIKSKAHPLFEANTRHDYSNTGYVLLASIIEKASGMSYANFLKKYIFNPLGMNNSLVYNRRLKPEIIKNYALGYLFLRDREEFVVPDNYEKTKMVYWLDGVVGDGTVNSTVNDLFLFDRGLYTTRIVSEKSIGLIFQNGILNDGSIAKHGFGWRVMEINGVGKIARHTGGWPGYTTFMERDMETDKTIIILQNQNNAVIPSEEIRAILYSGQN